MKVYQLNDSTFNVEEISEINLYPGYRKNKKSRKNYLLSRLKKSRTENKVLKFYYSFAADYSEWLRPRLYITFKNSKRTFFSFNSIDKMLSEEKKIVELMKK